MKIKSGYYMIPLICLLMTGCSNKQKVNDVPVSHEDQAVQNYFGKQVADPFRWLENGDNPEVKKWIDEQNNYANKILSGIPEGEKIDRRVKELETTTVTKYDPKLINGNLYFMQSTPPQSQAVVAFQKWPEGETKVLVDPNKKGNDLAVTGFWPSPDGRYLAYGMAAGGNEATTIHLLNINSGEEMDDTLSYAGGGTSPAGAVWDIDSKGLTYVRLPVPGTVPESELQFNAVMYHHILGQKQSDDKLAFGKGLSKIAEYIFIPSEDGKQAAMFVHYGDGNPDYVYLRTDKGDWKQVLDTSANVRVSTEINSGASWDAGNNLLLITYGDNPKGEILSINTEGKSTVVVPGEEWAYNSVSAVKDGFLIVKVKGADWKIDQYNSKGQLVRNVNLPQKGIGIDAVASSPGSPDALITYEGWTFPEKWDMYNSETGNLKNVFEVKPSADFSGVTFDYIAAISKDGTKVPVTLVRMNNITANGQRPAIVYGYGGFSIPQAPHFIGSYLAWLENGGIIAFANLRGGNEFGEGWHEAGKLAKKQNVFDDMYAAAESLVKNKWTNSDHLGIMGGSNGGLLMGAVLTQHPEAFKAVVSFVGIYDMIRNELFPNGQYNTSEYGTSSKEEDFNWLIAYSPYHNIKSSTAYPAVLLITGINDPRVASWQSRKFAAALQSANTSDNPVILLTRMDEGHGVTSSFSQRVGNNAAALTFFAHELGLKIK